MNTEDRNKQITDAMEAEEAELEIEGGHEEVSGGSEVPPAEEADELTAPSVGEASEEEIQIEAPFGGRATPQEVEGFEEENRM